MVASAAEVDDDPTMVVEAALVTCQLMGCTLDDTSVEHPQYYLQEVLMRISFSSSLLLPIKLCKYPLIQLWHSQER
jgi:hypothetical protein